MLRQPLSTRDLSIIIKLVPTSRCSSCKTVCPYRRMVDYIKLSGQDQGPIFRYANKLPVQKTAFAKYIKAIIANTELTSTKISPHCFRIGAATWAAKSSFSSEQIKAMRRWHSNSYQKYTRVASISSKPSA